MTREELKVCMTIHADLQEAECLFKNVERLRGIKVSRPLLTWSDVNYHKILTPMLLSEEQWASVVDVLYQEAWDRREAIIRRMHAFQPTNEGEM